MIRVRYKKFVSQRDSFLANPKVIKPDIVRLHRGWDSLTISCGAELVDPHFDMPVYMACTIDSHVLCAHHKHVCCYYNYTVLEIKLTNL